MCIHPETEILFLMVHLLLTHHVKSMMVDLFSLLFVINNIVLKLHVNMYVKLNLRGKSSCPYKKIYVAGE